PSHAPHSFPTRRSSDLAPIAPGTTLTAPNVFSARRSKFWLVMYSSACQRVQILIRFPTLALPAIAPTFGSAKCGTIRAIACGARSEEHTSELQSPYDLV